MDKTLRDQVTLTSVFVEELSASKYPMPEEFSLTIKLDPEIYDENDQEVTILANIKIGSQQAPFEITIRIKAIYSTVESIRGIDIMQDFELIAYPILAHASVLMSQIISSMDYPPLILSPGEILSMMDK